MLQKMRFFVFFLFCALSAGAHSWCANQPRYASVVMDAKSGRILHQISSQTRIYPASLTKMMTLYLVFEALRHKKLRLNQYLRVSRRAASQEPSSLGLKPGDRITVEQAILSLVCRSANDSAVVLAEAVAGSEPSFARQMTKKAWSLGLKRTTFRNASGLFHPGQMSTAHDMARLGISLIKHFPREYGYFKKRHFHFRGQIYKTHNHLVGRVPGVDGLKTGYIRKAGFNLVTSARRGDRRLMAVVIGGKSVKWRDRHMTSLLEMGFRTAHLPSKISSAHMANWSRGPFWRASRVPLKPFKHPGKPSKPVRKSRAMRFIQTRRAVLPKPKTVDDLLTAS